MLGATQQTKYFIVIEWILFFGLCGLSGVFMHGVLHNFFSGKTSFSESEEVMKELPTVVLCFSKGPYINNRSQKRPFVKRIHFTT